MRLKLTLDLTFGGIIFLLHDNTRSYDTLSALILTREPLPLSFLSFMLVPGYWPSMYNPSFSGKDSGFILLMFSIMVFTVMSPHRAVGGFGPLGLEVVPHPVMN